MTAWTWIPPAALLAIHDRQISRHGGAPGVRDRALPEMGCARPRPRAACGIPDVFELAAAHAFGISKAHAFIDGNKRTAFVAAFTFLRLKGQALRPDPRKGVRMMEAPADGEASERDFAGWLRTL